MKSKRNTFAFILIIVGVILLLRATLGIEEISRYLFPLGIIIFGFWLIFRKKKQDVNLDGQNIHVNINTNTDNNSFHSSTSQASFASSQSTDSHKSEAFSESQSFSERPEFVNADGRIRYSKAFGDMFIDCNGLNLQSIEVSAGVGDVEIKVHGGILNDGLNRIVVSGFIGDCRILVPPSMEMFAHCSNFIGDIEVLGRRASGFGNNIDAQTANYNTAQKRLYIAVNSFIGDVKIMTI